MKIVRAIALIALFMALLISVSNCGVRHLSQVPESFIGTWENPYEDAVRTLKIEPHQVTIINEDGEVRKCMVTGVRVRYATFSDSKKTDITCKKDSPDALAMAKHCKEYKKPFTWEINITQDDSEDDSYLEADEYVDLHCDESPPYSLGLFYKQG